jgi:CRP/FNR family transcriptional regulator, cyclic AMP receptor protein
MEKGINQLDSSDIELIKNACRFVSVRAGEDLIEKGDESDHLYIVADGSFKVYDDTLGEDFVHAILSKGDIFGEMSFIDGISRSASVKALNDSAVLRMGKGEFADLLAESPDTAMLFIFTLARVITKRLRDVNVALRNMTFNEQDRDTENVIKEVIAQMRQAVHIELSS